MSGKSIDYYKFCVCSFGEVVYTPEDNGYLKNSISIPRSKQCLYLFPTGTDGGLVGTFDRASLYIDRIVYRVVISYEGSATAC
jgi:hypothetical protein